MPTRILLIITIASFLVASLPVVAARGDEQNDASIDPGAQDALDIHQASARSYWSISEHAALMYWHIALEICAWIIILPIGTFP